MNGVYNLSSAVESKTNMKYLKLTGNVNEMTMLASYDLMSKSRGGWVLVELVDMDANEVLLIDGRSRTSSNCLLYTSDAADE